MATTLENLAAPPHEIELEEQAVAEYEARFRSHVQIWGELLEENLDRLRRGSFSLHWMETDEANWPVKVKPSSRGLTYTDMNRPKAYGEIPEHTEWRNFAPRGSVREPHADRMPTIDAYTRCRPLPRRVIASASALVPPQSIRAARNGEVARCTTIPASRTAASRPAPLAGSPTIRRASPGSGASGRRVSTVTSCPSASSSGISARPRTPRPPVTVTVAITAPPFNSPSVAPPPGAAGLRTSPQAPGGPGALVHLRPGVLVHPPGAWITATGTPQMRATGPVNRTSTELAYLPGAGPACWPAPASKPGLAEGLRCRLQALASIR